MYQCCFGSAGRGNGRGAMPFLMSFAPEPEIVTLAWIDNASVQFPLNIYATKGLPRLLRVLNLPHAIKLWRARVLRSHVPWPNTARQRAGPRRLFRSQGQGT